MLTSLTLRHFRSFLEKTISLQKKTAIIGDNASGKTNILYGIFTLFWYQYLHIDWKNIPQEDSKNVYIEGTFWSDTLSFSYDVDTQRKIYLINGKKITRPTLFRTFPSVVFFSPMDMNLLFLGPKYRREYLDTLLSQAHPEYKNVLKKYEHIVRSRNKVLKSICEWHAKQDEIIVWNTQFIQSAQEIYTYRWQAIDFFADILPTLTSGILKNNIPVTINYESKVDRYHIQSSMETYLEKNLQRDIFLQRTPIGPHVDDFSLCAAEKSLCWFASRWEIKSCLLSLTQTKISYLEAHTKKSPILLVDDLGSELDTVHIQHILKNLSYSQIVYTSILPIESENIHSISLF